MDNTLSPAAFLKAGLSRADLPFAFSATQPVAVACAPGRLDVMGGIADYTGALVCEMPLRAAAAVAVQKRDDRRLRLVTLNNDAGDGTPGAVELSLDDFYGSGALLSAADVQKLFTGANRWAAYVAGAFWVLARKRKLNRRAAGANIACYSTVPLGAGVSSSAALEVAALSALTAAYHLILDPLETAILAQMVENQVVDAPCGLMDQATSMLGEADRLLLLRCQPCIPQGYLDLPQQVRFLGINSNVKHSVGGAAYRNARTAAFMAHAIIVDMCKSMGMRGDPTRGYLANVKRDVYQTYLRRVLPKTMRGADFLARYQRTIDLVTRVDPDVTYAVRAAADHHVLENSRVERFVDAMRSALETGGEAALKRAGRLMYASHASYGKRAGLGCLETDLIVSLVRQLGPKNGFYGAKITGGGSGGTVAVLYRADARPKIDELCGQYAAQTGLTAQIIEGSGPGAALMQPEILPGIAVAEAGAGR